MMSGVRVQEAKPLASMPFILTSYNKDKQAIGINLLEKFFLLELLLNKKYQHLKII